MNTSRSTTRTPVDVSDVTCLVGKNESGKTSILQSLYKLNPILPEHGNYDVTDEFPRAEVEDYRQEVEAKRRDPAEVVSALFELTVSELAPIEQHFGKGVIEKHVFAHPKATRIRAVSWSRQTRN